jgi:C-terminal processing protease CtpA/Prc
MHSLMPRSCCMQLLGVVLLALCLIRPAGAQEPRTWDFQNIEPGTPPQEWTVPPIVSRGGWKAEARDGDGAPSRFIELRNNKGRAVANAEFGNIMTSIDAKPYRGKAVELSARVRVVSAAPRVPLAEPGATSPARGQLWLRVDRATGDVNRPRVGFFDNMGDRAIAPGAWQTYTIRGAVSRDASFINIGLLATGALEAIVQFDDVTLRVLDDADLIQPPAPLSDKQVDSLVAFARLYGYLRWFHPADQAATADWNNLALRGVRAAQNAESADELAESLRRLTAMVAPSVAVSASDIAGDFEQASVLPQGVTSDTLTAWVNVGMDARDPSRARNQIYFSKRVTWKAGGVPMTPENVAAPAFGSHVTRKLSDSGVWCRIPFVVWTSGGATLPAPDANAPALPDLPLGHYPTGDDRSTRLAGVIIAWNVFQHFYPYFDVVNVDWDAVLPDMLRRAAIDDGEEQFLTTMRHLVALLQDGHGNVGHPSYYTPYALPIVWDWAAREPGADATELVVVHVPGTVLSMPRGVWDAAASSGLRRGDVITAINARPLQDVTRELALEISGSPQWIKARLRDELRKPRTPDPVVLTVAREDGSKHDIAITPLAIEGYGTPPEPRPEMSTELQSGVHYIDVTRCNDEQFFEAVHAMVGANAVIVDVRGYPGSLGPQSLAYFTDQPMRSAKWNVPVVPYPDRRDMTFSISGWDVPKAAPHVKAKIAFVTDGRAISYAETYLGIAEHFKLGHIVGEATAGANGNVNGFEIPGGYTIGFTGMKVIRHDDAQHHLHGIRPTVPAVRTVKGIREGRDEVLEAAIRSVGIEPALRPLPPPVYPEPK